MSFSSIQSARIPQPAFGQNDTVEQRSGFTIRTRHGIPPREPDRLADIIASQHAPGLERDAGDVFLTHEVGGKTVAHHMAHDRASSELACQRALDRGAEVALDVSPTGIRKIESR